jgi:crotonobetainyl-CoA:carnitine CoA-transferase CaiB-like acyl-CoA transferase
MKETDALVTTWTQALTREEVCERLLEHKVPHAAVRDLTEVVDDPHMHQRKMLEWLDHPEFGRIIVPDSPIRIHGADRLPAAASARLGEHNDEVLTSVLGLSSEEIQVLRAAGAFGPVTDESSANLSDFA